MKNYIYEEIYQYLKQQIESDVYQTSDKLPSKRMLADRYDVSPLTVDKAYQQLIEEGYVFSKERQGFFVSEKIELFVKHNDLKPIKLDFEKTKTYRYDFSTGKVDTTYFPHKVWAKLSREVLAEQHMQMLNEVDALGLYDLRIELSKHMEKTRGFYADPNQIIVGSSTSQLLNLVIELLGRNLIYAIEEPSYPKIKRLFETLDVKYHAIPMTEQGIDIDILKNTNTNCVHVVPSHQFPSGVTLPIQQRKELLNWVYQDKDRYVIEDDYDSEFKFTGKPILALKALDELDRVIYMNTFSKSLAPSFRVAYLILPKRLASQFHKIKSYHQCTVPNFEQYILHKFMKQGYFDRHIRRMHKVYRQKIEIIKRLFEKTSNINIEYIDTGLHFVIQLQTTRSLEDVRNDLEKNSVYILSTDEVENNYLNFICGYASIPLEEVDNRFSKLISILKA